MVEQQTLGITQETIWEPLGYSPTKISGMKTMQTADSPLAAATGPTALPRPSSIGTSPSGRSA